MKVLFRRLLLGLGGLALAALIVYGFMPQPVPVDLDTVKRGSLQVTVDDDGKTRVRERYVVASPLAGQMRRIPWKAGDPVYSDQTLLTTIAPQLPPLLDASSEAQAVAQVDRARSAQLQAQALLERAQAAFRDTEQDLRRLRSLHGTAAFQEQELDDAIREERMAAADLRAAQFAVQVANFEHKQAEAVLLRRRKVSSGEPVPLLELHSPITGKVFRVIQESETIVTPGQQLLEVGDPTDIEVEIDVLSEDAVKIHKGARVYLEHWGGERPLLAEVRVVEPSGFLKISALGVEEQRVNVIADLVEPLEARPSLGDNYRVEARIVIWERENVLKVPAGALFRQGKGWAVFVVADGRAAIRHVEVGRSNGLETEVLEGLEEDEAVILHPSDKIKSGVAVVPRGSQE